MQELLKKLHPGYTVQRHDSFREIQAELLIAAKTVFFYAFFLTAKKPYFLRQYLRITLAL